MTHDPTFWLLARSSGLGAYAVLTLSVLAGLVLKSRPFPSLKASRVTEIHRTLALSGLSLLALHGISLVLDTDRPQRKLQSCRWSGPCRPLPEASRTPAQKGVRRFFGRSGSSFQQGQQGHHDWTRVGIPEG